MHESNAYLKMEKKEKMEKKKKKKERMECISVWPEDWRGRSSSQWLSIEAKDIRSASGRLELPVIRGVCETSCQGSRWVRV